MKTKFYISTFLGILGITAILIIFVTSTNGFINSASAQQQQQFTANLSGSNGVPPIKTPAMGIAKFTFNNDDKSLRYILNVTNINNVIAAHIHSGNGKQNGPIVLSLFENPSVKGKVNGVLSKGNNTASDLKGPLSGKQLPDLLNLIKSGNAYVNVHTIQHPNGEIRGQITSRS